MNWLAVLLPLVNARVRCIAGSQFSPLLTLNYPIGEWKTALNQRICALSDRR